MPTFKLVLSDPMSGKARQFEVKDPLSQRFTGLKTGDEIDAIVLKDFIEIPKGFKIRITGGSGVEGAPMHSGVPGPVKKYILAEGPPGYRPPKRGLKKKKLVRGNTVSDSIVQINAVVVYPKDHVGPPVIPLGVKEVKKE
ncbi:MAG: 30S ribosomal protein S6e [Pyrobaculum sp.]